MRTYASRSPRAFTLIEVMIAVLVLGLGLLGLGAVFPVVVRAQRTSTDDTLGTAAINSARAFIGSYDFKSAMLPWGAGVDTRNFWRDWRDDPRVPPNLGLGQPSPSESSMSADEQGYWVIPPVNDVTNALIMGVPANPAQNRPLSSQVVIPVKERLFPQGANSDPAPQFVWDIAVHRVSDQNGGTNSTVDDLEVVVFVRRLDQRIKIEPGLTLFHILTGERNGGVANALRRRPVGVYASGAQAELPSGTGLEKYAVPITADVEYRFNPPGVPERDRLYLTSGVSDAYWQMFRQPGQKLVDNLGQIHTVRAWVAEPSGNRYVELESGIRTNAGSAGTIQQVVFTPQVPAAVFIQRIKP